MGTAIISAILLLIIGLIIFKLRKDKKSGKSSCGCNCGCCPNSQLCHSKKTKTALKIHSKYDLKGI